MLVTSHLPIQITKFYIVFLTCPCAPTLKKFPSPMPSASPFMPTMVLEEVYPGGGSLGTLVLQVFTSITKC